MPGDRRRDRVGDQQECLVDALTAEHVVSRESEDQCDPERRDTQGYREHDSSADRGPVGSAAHQGREIVEADPLRRSSERIGQLEGLDESAGTPG